jgi:hypothetical protein
MKPTMKASGTKRLTLSCDEPPSNFAFTFNLRRYTLESERVRKRGSVSDRHSSEEGLTFTRCLPSHGLPCLTLFAQSSSDVASLS